MTCCYNPEVNDCIIKVSLRCSPKEIIGGGGGEIPSNGQSFVPYICYSHYMKEGMARNTDLN